MSKSITITIKEKPPAEFDSLEDLKFAAECAEQEQQERGKNFSWTEALKWQKKRRISK